MKKWIPIFMLLIFAQPAMAQGLRIGAHANFIKPNASLDFSEYGDDTFDNTGFGVTAFGMADLVLMNITGHIGYLNFGEQSYDITIPGLPGDPVALSAKAKVTAMPILVGLRWEFGLFVGPKFFFGVQAGFHNFTYEFEGTAVDENVINEKDTESIFSFAPVVGLSWSSLDASLFYMVVEDFNYAGLRVGYTFGFGL